MWRRAPPKPQAARAHYRTFVDANGVRWNVEARLVSEGTDAIPVEFAFTSQCAEHRNLQGAMPECLA
jgi:hypothetical protein